MEEALPCAFSLDAKAKTDIIYDVERAMKEVIGLSCTERRTSSQKHDMSESDLWRAKRSRV